MTVSRDNLSASGETDDGTRSLLGESDGFAAAMFGRGGEGVVGDCGSCCRYLISELATGSGRTDVAGSPKIAVEFKGGLESEG